MKGGEKSESKGQKKNVENYAGGLDKSKNIRTCTELAKSNKKVLISLNKSFAKLEQKKKQGLTVPACFYHSDCRYFNIDFSTAFIKYSFVNCGNDFLYFSQSCLTVVCFL